MITATILTKNNEKTIARTLESTKFLSEVIILDNGSTDKTLEIAASYPHVKIEKHSFIGFGPLHNLAAKASSNDWILSIDSDEVITPELQKELQSISLNTSSTYSFPFKNYFNGKHIKWCGWYPDRHTRLYHREVARFSSEILHEKILGADLNSVSLNAPIVHYSYNSISDFLKKMERYSTLFAEQYKGKRRSSLCTAVLHGFFAFFKSYILKRGIFGGREGYIISAYNAHTAYYKYLKLLEANKYAS